jgi:hypothetical protein
VLADANRQVAGHAQVEHAGFAGHEVDVGSALHRRELWHWERCASTAKCKRREISPHKPRRGSGLRTNRGEEEVSLRRRMGQAFELGDAPVESHRAPLASP